MDRSPRRSARRPAAGRRLRRTRIQQPGDLRRRQSVRRPRRRRRVGRPATARGATLERRRREASRRPIATPSRSLRPRRRARRPPPRLEFASIPSKILVTGRKTGRGSTWPRYSSAGAAAWGSLERSRSKAPASGFGSYQDARALRPLSSAISADSRKLALKSRISAGRVGFEPGGWFEIHPVGGQFGEGRACGRPLAAARGRPVSTRTCFMFLSPRCAASDPRSEPAS